MLGRSRGWGDHSSCGLISHIELILIATASLSQTRLQKTLVAAAAYDDGKIRNLFDGIVSFPAVTPSLEGAVEASLASERPSHILGSTSTGLIQEFLELDFESQRALFQRCVERFTRAHDARVRSLPGLLFHMLIKMMTDGPLQQAFVDSPLSEESKFAIPRNFGTLHESSKEPSIGFLIFDKFRMCF